MFTFVFCKTLSPGTILFSAILVVREMGISGASDRDPFYLATVMRIFDTNTARDSTR